MDSNTDEAERGFMGIKIKTDFILLWVIVFLNLILTWITYVIVLGLNVDNLNAGMQKNGAVMWAKTLILVQGIFCLFAGVFLISMAKTQKFAVVPIACILIGVAIPSFILAARLGSINKQATNGKLKPETVSQARTMALVLASVYTAMIALLVGYMWLFKPDLYNLFYHKLTSVFDDEPTESGLMIEETPIPKRMRDSSSRVQSSRSSNPVSVVEVESSLPSGDSMASHLYESATKLLRRDTNMNEGKTGGAVSKVVLAAAEAEARFKPSDEKAKRDLAVAQLNAKDKITSEQSQLLSLIKSVK